MRRPLLSIYLLLCSAVFVYGQSTVQLSAAVALVQRAYDNNSDSLDYYAGRALPVAIELKDIQAEMKLQRLRCDKLFINGQFDNAIKILLEVARHAEKYPPSEETALLYYAISQVNGFNKYTETGEQYLRKGLEAAARLNNKSLLGNGYNRMGIFYEKYKKNTDSALYFYQQSLDYNDKANDTLGKAYSLENIAGIYAGRKQMDRALACQKQALMLKLQKGRKIDLALAYINIAETFDQMDEADSASSYTLHALALSREINYRDLESYSCSMLAKLHEKNGDYQKALFYERLSAAVKDSIYTERKNKQMAELNAKYETEKKVERINELGRQAIIQQLQLKQRNIYLLVAALLLIAGIVIFYLVHNRSQLRQKAIIQEEINKRQDIVTREVINAEERERKRLAADLHDGVGQLLSATLLNLNSFFSKTGAGSSPQAGQIIALVTESYDELRSISHQMMPNALMKTGLDMAVKELAARIDKPGLDVSLVLTGINERMKMEVETVLYRVIQEAVHNVIRHAHASMLHLQITRDEDGITVAIEDNGKGFDKKKTEPGGIGLKNMYSRVTFHQGTVDVESMPGKGTLVVIHIPARALQLSDLRVP